jgi:D-lactate dehydrogenase (cytochrome)
LSQVKDGKNVKHDISLPISDVPVFMERAAQLVESIHPGARIIAFGHLGDGNLHYNVAAPLGEEPDQIWHNKGPINDAVHSLVTSLQGSISAEHGIGRMKAADLRRFKSPVEMRLFQAIKKALDPKGILNPGKVLFHFDQY